MEKNLRRVVDEKELDSMLLLSCTNTDSILW